MLNIAFDKPACQNIRESLRKEWLETNALGDYASSTIPCCNTRKYHGLLVANLNKPEGRHVLLSTLEESLTGGGKEFFISCRKHPGVFFPHGQEYMQSMENNPWPTFRYRIGDLLVSREVLLPHRQQAVLIRYQIEHADASSPRIPIKLLLKPLLAFRNVHALTRANGDLRAATSPRKGGFSIQPYGALPPLFMRVSGTSVFTPSPDWCRAVQYPFEEERGFDFEEDLFLPGVFEVAVSDKPVYVAASATELAKSLESIWQAEAKRRTAKTKAARAAAPGKSRLLGHLAERAADFLITTPHGDPAVLAGYHWFDAWGRDTCIALPGLTLFAGNVAEGERQLSAIGASAKNGLIPNCFTPDGVSHAYNSVDASLWYVWAVQQFDLHGKNPDLIRNVCWPVIKTIIDAFTAGPIPTVFVDSEGLLHAGSALTQLTWMDAKVDGRPVTPRHGCPVEINALWYNALAYADELAARYHEPKRRCPDRLDMVRRSFNERFWINDQGGYLADVWRDGQTDGSLRPNQIFAVSLPHPVLAEERRQQVVDQVRRTLLTPFGLRTLAPGDADYRAVYYGRAEARDSAYHQGTVWPWLLGAYGDALLRVSPNSGKTAAELLDLLSPLFVKHLARTGLGSISEVFDASPPYYPNGCIAQAWSVAETLRLLTCLRQAAPKVFSRWEAACFDDTPLSERTLIRN
ncbi:MAG: amylo-alpha-1,6-glucosidase [Deltaproteobacteria bacterium]|nr:amylo-alpha-1,6-glucosidase [Deltaproteobacteria bacterium]